MSPIRIRTPTGSELTFASREEFGHAAGSGRISSDSEVFHSRGNCWLPVTAHPVWPSVSTLKAETAVATRRRSPDLILIYPDSTAVASPVEPPATEVDPFDAGPILAPDEIERVLHAPRPSNPHLATALAATEIRVRVSGPHVGPLLEKAMKSVPTFSRAFLAAAEMVQTRIP